MHDVVSTGTNFTKNVTFYEPIASVSFARYCDKMYVAAIVSLYSGLVRINLTAAVHLVMLVGFFVLC